MLWLFFCYAARSIIVLTMDKLEYFGKVIKVVTELTDVSEEAILGKSREAEVVDARWMVIHFMRVMGYKTSEIARLINHPERTVNHATQMFMDRVRYSYSLGNIFFSARQQLL